MFLTPLKRVSSVCGFIVALISFTMANDGKFQTDGGMERVRVAPQIDESAADVRFGIHLLFDLFEVVRQATHDTSDAWRAISDATRFGTMCYNVHCFDDVPSDSDLNAEQICQMIHYTGDMFERVAEGFDYTGWGRTAANFCQFGGVAAYIGVRLYKRFCVPQLSAVKKD